MSLLQRNVVGLTHARHRTGFGKEELDLEERRALDRWNSLSTGDKIRDVAARHEYGIIGGAWALSLAGSFGYIMRDPHQSFAQKVRSVRLSVMFLSNSIGPQIVQARMWAQGLTIGIVIAAGAMAHSNRTKMSAPNKHVDHSWRDVLEAEEAHKRVQ
jgi:hypothetical protein